MGRKYLQNIFFPPQILQRKQTSASRGFRQYVFEFGGIEAMAKGHDHNHFRITESTTERIRCEVYRPDGSMGTTTFTPAGTDKAGPGTASLEQYPGAPDGFLMLVVHSNIGTRRGHVGPTATYTQAWEAFQARRTDKPN